MAEKPPQRSSDPSLVHIPPQSLEAEESLLSAILNENQILLDIVDILAPEDFYRSDHLTIYNAMLDLFNRNEPIDLVTLTNILQGTGNLEKIGGAVRLANIAEFSPVSVNAEYHAKIVHEKACLRKLIEKGTKIVQRCYEHQGGTDEVIDFAEKSIFEVSENRIRPSFYPLQELVTANIDTLEEREGNKALVTGVPSGFRDLDHLTSGFQPSDLIILAARPSMGKTAFALNIARNAALDGNIPVAIFSLEMSKEQLSMRMLCAEARVDSFRLRGGFLSREDWQRLTDAASVLTEAPVYIDDAPDITVMEIRAKARRLKMDKGLGLIIIDYLQLMRVHRSAERRDLEISEISRSLKSLAKELSIPVLALSQLNRKLEERSDKRPLLSDLRESGALEQDADVVAFIYRDEVYNRDENNPKKGTAEILLKKQRNGPTGEAVLTFLNSYTRFEDSTGEDFAPY